MASEVTEYLEYIKDHMPVYAEGPGGLSGASDVHIGNVDKVEGDRYIKLTKNDSPDGQHHWFPASWIRNVNERALYLNKTVTQVAEELLDQAPAA
ncbi:MAG TPA: DUF2171 domain-containing protein [Thermosynechococcaceae cyanobacterium]